MSHSSEKTWSEISGQVSAAAQNVRDHLQHGEELYQRLQEVYSFAGGTAQALADQLFFADWNSRSELQASAEEVAMTQDAIDAMTAIHELYQAATNIAVTQSDRLTELRRMI